MAAESEADISPTSPAPSDLSCRSQVAGREADIREILKSLPSKADLANMLGKQEATFQTKVETIEAEVQQVNQRVTDSAQITHLSSTMESQASMAGFQRYMDDLDNRGCRNNLRVTGLHRSYKLIAGCY
ncbi:Hypothetical predicted protein [Pelobates cultripes]|uniref:Uncharacterized protein n=1 Tax=Pelobates cultripes TaxID=61616 RepID=A0AAD1R5A0_PELCU|nr:Hypothetical predicted protein [Pelobates cultripes]